MSKTTIPPDVKRNLWFAAHGRCEFKGCNKCLYVNGVTMEECNISNFAHIIGDSANGPRGNKDSDALAKDPSNLILLCPECHKLIDSKQGEERYTVEILQAMKKEHEDRIELVTSIQPTRKSLVVAYGPKIGNDTPYFHKDVLNNAIMPEWYPVDLIPIEIQMKNSVLNEDMAAYWLSEQSQIETLCNNKVIKALETGICAHISLFPIGPQPLLVKLGTGLNDKYNVQVYQKHREPDTWIWLEPTNQNDIVVVEPKQKGKEPILVIALSANAIKERVNQRFGNNASIWTITCNEPNNDMMKSMDQLNQFMSVARKVMDDIKSNSNGYDTLRVFMSAPASCAVELGRIRMPKADLKWKLYDYKVAENADIETITIE